MNIIQDGEYYKITLNRGEKLIIRHEDSHYLKVETLKEVIYDTTVEITDD